MGVVLRVSCLASQVWQSGSMAPFDPIRSAQGEEVCNDRSLSSPSSAVDAADGRHVHPSAENSEAVISESIPELYLRSLRLAFTGAAGRTPDSDGGPFNESARHHGALGCQFCLTSIGSAMLEHYGKLVVETWRQGVSGDAMEAGVWQGGISMYVAGLSAVYPALSQNGGPGQRRIVLADSFHGIPASTSVASESFWHSLPLDVGGYTQVEDNFRRFGLLSPHVRFVEGYFRDSLPICRSSFVAEGRRLALLRIDVDMYESYADVLYNLYDLVSVGGFIICDDCRCIPEADRAVIGFMWHHRLPTSVLAIPGSPCGVYWRKDEDSNLDTDAYHYWLSLRRNSGSTSYPIEDIPTSGPTVEEAKPWDRWHLIQERLAVVHLENNVVSSPGELAVLCRDSLYITLLLGLPSEEVLAQLLSWQRSVVWEVSQALLPMSRIHCARIAVTTLGATDLDTLDLPGVSWSGPSGTYMILSVVCGDEVDVSWMILMDLYYATSKLAPEVHVAYGDFVLRTWLSSAAQCPTWPT